MRARFAALAALAGAAVATAIVRGVWSRTRGPRGRRRIPPPPLPPTSEPAPMALSPPTAWASPLASPVRSGAGSRSSLGSLRRWLDAVASLVATMLGSGGGEPDGDSPENDLASPHFGSHAYWPGDEGRAASAPGRARLQRKARARTSPHNASAMPSAISTAHLRRGGLTAAQVRASMRARLTPPDAGDTEPATKRHSRRFAMRARTYFGLDIGGSLAKIVHFEPAKKSKASLRRLASFIHASATYQEGVRDVHLQLGALSGTLHFIRFETRRMAAFLQLVKAEGLHAEAKEIYATGGGAHKFADDFELELGVHLEKLDELACCVKGVTWLLDQVPDELFEYKEIAAAASESTPDSAAGPSAPPAPNRSMPDDAYAKSTGEAMEAVPYRIPDGSMYPFILVNIGSGVSILRIQSEDDFERISGTAVGGGTFLGLCRLLGCGDTFDEALENAAHGDDGKVNLLVEDIYGGGGYDAFGLPPKLIASMFGKVLRRNDPYEGVEKSDVCRALLVMISQVIAQVAYLSAVNSGVKRLVFSGTFLHSNQVIAFCIQFLYLLFVFTFLKLRLATRKMEQHAVGGNML
ncbi:fumble-domain-containing protein [Pavlovales sp. CCMP2436]|nr:fumble-domain-containing protein [Pavlovales sp. CCMP2436]